MCWCDFDNCNTEEKFKNQSAMVQNGPELAAGEQMGLSGVVFFLVFMRFWMI